jgi:urea carboxylase-associated protein 2
MPVLPAADATDLPEDVAGGDVLWDETLEAGEYAAHRLPRGAVVRLADIEGDACAHVVIHNALLPSERLNLADTVKVQWQAYPTAGSALLSDRGRVLTTIVEDTSGRHDAFCSAPNRAAHERKYGDGSVEGGFPNARDRLIVALAKFGLDRRDLPPSMSFFKGTRVAAEGTIVLDDCPAVAPSHVQLRCELDLLLSVANVPHVLDVRPEYTCTPMRLTAWMGKPASERDSFRIATPEVERAFQNTDDWLAGLAP